MKCSNCGAQLPEHAKFCFSCGAKQEVQQKPAAPELSTAQDILEAPDASMTSDAWTVPTMSSPADNMDNTVLLNELSENLSKMPTDEMPIDDMPADEMENFHPFSENLDEPSGQFCPYCGMKNDSDATFCCGCGRSLIDDGQVQTPDFDDADDTSPKKVKKQKTPKHSKKAKNGHTGKIIGFAAGGLVLVAAIVFVVIKLVGGSGSSDTSHYLNYMKSGKLAFLDVGSRKKEPIPYKGASTDASNTETVKYSEDGKYMYFLSNGDGAGYVLYAVKTGKGMGDAIKIDSNIYQYWIMKNGKEVVYVRDDVLYKNNLDGEKEKVASDVIRVLWDVNEKNLVWCEYRDDTYYWYYRPMDLSGDEVKLFEGGMIFYYTDDLQKLYMTIDESIYIIHHMGEKEKIVEDALPISVAEDGTLYYIKKQDAVVCAADYVNDDMAAADAAMTKPVEEDFVKTELKNGPDGLEKVESTDWDAYYEAQNAYYEKQDRDEIREALGTYTFDKGVSTLYAYKDGQETLIDENAVIDSAAVHGSVIAYNRINIESMPKVNLSEIDYAGEVEDIYNENIESITETWIAGDSVKPHGLGVTANCFSLYTDTENQKAYILTKDEGARLLSFNPSVENSVSEIAENVDTIETVVAGHIYYISDAIDTKGDLYDGDKLIASDVVLGSVEQLENTEKVYYASDFNMSKGRFTLKVFDGKESKKVADDVYMFKFLDDHTAALLTDYSSSRYSGDLMLYTGKDELEKLDDGVAYIIGAYDASFYF